MCRKPIENSGSSTPKHAYKLQLCLGIAKLLECSKPEHEAAPSLLSQGTSAQVVKISELEASPRTTTLSKRM